MSTRYGEGALVRAIQSIDAAPTSDRNNTFYAQSRGCFELAAGGEIEFDRVHSTLLLAGFGVGLGKVEIRATLKSAEREGRKKPRTCPDGSESRGTTAAPRYVFRPSPAPKYPPPYAVKHIARLVQPVTADDGVCAGLYHRGIDPGRVAAFKLAYALPGDLSDYPVEVPRCKANGRFGYAPSMGLRLVLPLYDTKGQARSLLFRYAVKHPDQPDAPPKSLALKGQRKGLALMNRAARGLFDRALEHPAPTELVITEGEVDFLTAGCEPVDAGTVRAVIGVFTGSWDVRHAARIPSDCRVIIATDPDEAGERYADKIIGTLGRQAFHRWTNHEGKDLTAAGGLSGGTVT